MSPLSFSVFFVCCCCFFICSVSSVISVVKLLPLSLSVSKLLWRSQSVPIVWHACAKAASAPSPPPIALSTCSHNRPAKAFWSGPSAPPADAAWTNCRIATSAFRSQTDSPISMAAASFRLAGVSAALEEVSDSPVRAASVRSSASTAAMDSPTDLTAA